MKKIKILILLFIVTGSCTQRDNKLNEDDGSEPPTQGFSSEEQVVNMLMDASNWFGDKREDWMIMVSMEGDGFRNDRAKWGRIVNSWVDSSGYFSSNFVKRQMARQLERKYDHFGLMFFEHNLGGMLHSLSSKDTAQVEARLKPLSDDRYVYADYFDVVLNSVPIPDQIDDYDWTWLWDKGENGEIWLFSVEIIRENGSWVIDKIDRRFDVPQAVDDSDKM